MTDEVDTARLDEVAGWVRDASSVTVLTGAGVSTDSGIPDFRGPQGVWTRDPEAERLATLQVYLSEPEARKRSWRWRMSHPAWDARPNAAHRALVGLERAGRLEAIVTQNIDGLHQRAGSDPDKVIEVHGSMRHVTCVGCGQRWPIEHAFERIRMGDDDPSCEDCGAILKTTTVFFGEGLDPATMARAQSATEACDLFIAAGTSLQVHPVAALPGVALEAGARLVIVNRGETPYDDLAEAVFDAGVGDVLPALVADI